MTLIFSNFYLRGRIIRLILTTGNDLWPQLRWQVSMLHDGIFAATTLRQ